MSESAVMAVVDGARQVRPSTEETSRAPLFRPVEIGDLERAHVERPPDWWSDYVPSGVVTLLGAHGGTGKSFVGAMLGVAIATGQPLFGVPTRQGKVAIFDAEDGAGVVRHRLQWICRALEVSPAELTDRLHVLDATEGEPALFHEITTSNGRKQGTTTATFRALSEYLDAHEIDVLIVDNASDTYEASEIDRARVRGFMRALTTLAKPDRGVMLMAHIDKQVARGESRHSEGYSGSTAWHNSARSRLFLSREKDGTLTLEHQKANHGRMRPSLTLQWPENGLPDLIQPASGIVAMIEERGHIKTMLTLVHEFTQRGERVSTATTSRTNAALLFAREPRFPKSLKAGDVFDLLRQAERQQLIHREVVKGHDRKPREVWSLTPKGAATAATAATPQVTAQAAHGAGAAATAATSPPGGTGGESAHTGAAA